MSLGTATVMIWTPRPVAMPIINQLSSIGSNPVIHLDGSGSSDWDSAFSELAFVWTIDGQQVGSGSAAQAATVDVVMLFGTHEIVLQVTDPDGLTDEVALTVTIDPAQLSVLEIDEAKVDFEHDQPKVEIRGQIGLPFGVDYGELSPQTAASLALAGIDVLPVTPVMFAVQEDDGHHWKFVGPPDSIGIQRFEIDWKGGWYKLMEPGFPVELESKLITTSETLLSVKLKHEEIDSPFTMYFGGLAQVQFDVDALVTMSSVPFDVEEPGKKLTLTLPFPLLDTTVISFDFGDGLDHVIYVGDELKGSIGRYRLDLNLDGSLLPSGVASTPSAFGLAVTIGAEGYAGATSLGPDDLVVHETKWTLETVND